MTRVLIILTFLALHLTSQNQDLPVANYNTLDQAIFIATYSMESKQDSLNLDRIRKQEALLFLGKDISFFTGKTRYIHRQERRKIKTAAQLMDWSTKKGNYYMGFIYLIYKNYPKEKLTFTKATLDGSFLIEESLDLFDWQLTGDTSTIAGYKSQKAICDFGGRSWVAWFTPEIPYNDGPYKFNGLPGLIVKIHDTKMHYVYELKYFEKAKPDQIIEIKEYPYIKTTKQKYFKAVDAIREDIISRVKEKGMGSHSQQVAARNMTRRNNPIELKRK